MSGAPRGVSLLVGLAAAISAAGCARKDRMDPCADAHPSLIEVRDGQGALQLATRAIAGNATDATVCDGNGRALGTLTVLANGLAIKNPAGDVESRLEATGPGIDEPRLTWAKGTARLHGDGALLRILDGAGVPLGQIEKQPDRTLAYDPAGRGIATVERMEKQDDSRLALRAPDGTTLRITLGLHTERAAATFALPGLPLPEALLVARYLDGK